MIYTEEQIIDKIKHFCATKETEVMELKEAKSNFSFNDIGKYFSALSNEANIRNTSAGWLIFGVTNAGIICGSNYRKDGALQQLKKEIVEKTNQRLTFLEIYEVTMQDKRVIAFQIPPAIQGIPTTWDGASYARENESLSPLPLNKVDLIRNQIGYDWSKEIVPDADITDLDPEAILRARELFTQKKGEETLSGKMVADMSDIELLNKMGITIKGRITRTALLLLGKEEASHYFDGFVPRITWSLYNADLSVKTYEHFNMPLLLAVDKAFSRIRNVKYRYITKQQTLFPDEVDQYSAELIVEVINNCIAHQDYRLNGKINIEEFEDKLVFINEGAFIPETIETAIDPSYKAPYYRNPFLCTAMVNLYMIDTNSMGIPRMYKIQRDRFFPLPSYDFSQTNRVIVTIYGKILDASYTRLLCADDSLNIATVFLLDQVQKKELISRESYQMLKKQKLVEGRYPNIYVSYEVADMVGERAKYIKNKGLNDDACIQYILNALGRVESASKQEILEWISNILPDVLDQKQKAKKTSNLLQTMRKKRLIDCEGAANQAKWHLVK